jgi:hypothetical protein|tara:strand:+ start:55 stop:267 length:213 start_codon:yes stop_codon:yes gene_type:complete
LYLSYFFEVYNYSDSKKYFYDYVSFDIKAIITVNFRVELGYDLSKLEIQIDSLYKKIYSNKIPDVKYFDL